MLEQKVAVVTGASRGIGRAIAEKLAEEGVFVVINYRGNEEQAKQVQQTIKEQGGNAGIYGCDVSDFSACEAFFKDVIETYGRLDILVNNAGITRDGLLMKMTESDYDAVLQTNLKGTFNRNPVCIQADASSEGGADHQYFFSIRYSGKCRTGKLQCIQSRCDRADQICGKRTRIQRNYSQCSGAGIYQNRNDRSSF